MSIVDQLQQGCIQSDVSEMDDLPELSTSVLDPDTTRVQVGDMILLRPTYRKGRWPGLIKSIRPKASRSKKAPPEPKKTSRRKSVSIEEGFTYSNDFLTVLLLNFPCPDRVQQEIKPPSRVELYLSHKKNSVISEWQTNSTDFITSLFKAFDEAETYLRKRSVHTLTPGTAVEQYMQVKRSRLDFDFEGIEHTDQDKCFRYGDYTDNNFETVDDNTAFRESINSIIEDADSSSSKDATFDISEEPTKPCLNPEEFICLTERIICCKELLRAIYLEKRSSVRHKTYFCNNRQDKIMLKQAYLTSFDVIPYKLDNSQKTEMLDIMLDFANTFVNRNPRKKTFSIPTYAYDVLLPECTDWLMVELESHPLIFTSNDFIS